MLKKIILISLIIVVLTAAFGSYILSNQLSNLEHISINKSSEALGIDTESPEAKMEQRDVLNDYADNKVINIAFFGVDEHQPGENGRSDSIMIITIDFTNQKIKMSSVMRDLLVYIENHGKDKINHAYSYGGPQLAIKTINQNLGTDIKDFVAVEFAGLEKIVNTYGGVNVDVKSSEVPFINESISQESNYIQQGGMQLLNGQQAVAYARVRYVGDGDFERTERQRTILKELIFNARDKGLPSFTENVIKILPYVKTSLDKKTILYLGAKCFNEDINQLEEEQFPMDGYWRHTTINGVYYLAADLNVTKNHVKDYIYYDKYHLAKN